MNTDAATGASGERRQIPRPESAPGVDADNAPSVAQHDWSDLRARIISGLVLASGGVSAAIAGGPWLAGATGAAVVAMSYEWARMSEPKATMPAFVFALVGALGAVMFASWRELDLGLGWLTLCAAASAFRRRSVVRVIETVLGAIYIGAPCAVFLWLRGKPEGLDIILTLFAVIWSADVFAYLGGKLIGGPKIAAGLSPNKTWSGIIAGVVAGIAAGYAFGAMFGTNSRTLIWLGVGASIAFTGLMGDLFESFLKRRFGVKDASRIIPGHGGVLDRIDGLMAATLLTGLVLALWPTIPHALVGAAP